MTRLDQAIATLGWPHVQVLIVSDGIDDSDWPDNPVDDLLAADWPTYEVDRAFAISGHSVSYRSSQAEARFPGHRNVAIRVERLITFR
jgi:hypothetical protein